MKVNKNSWHYKAVTGDTLGVSGISYWKVSRSLCMYFWQVLGMLIYKAGILLIGLPIILSIFVVIPLTSLVGWVVTGNVVRGDTGLIILFAEVCAILIFLIVFGGSVAYNKYEDFQYKKMLKEDDNPVEKEPNLVVEFIKAKKEKLCPMLEFVEENTDGN